MRIEYKGVLVIYVRIGMGFVELCGGGKMMVFLLKLLLVRFVGNCVL